MTAVLHVVGDADLGIPTSGPSAVPAADRPALRERRLAMLRTAGPAQRRTLAASLAWDDGQPVSGAAAPLTTVLAAHPSVSTAVLLCTTAAGDGSVGTAGPDLSTESIGAALGEMLRADPALFGVRVESAMVPVPGLAEQQVLGTIADAIGAQLPPGEPVAVVWGSGSTTLALASLAAVIQSGSAWRLVHPRTGRDVSLAGRRRPLDPRVAWFLRLGYPGQLLTSRGQAGLTDRQAAVVRKVDDQLSLRGGVPREAALAALIAADLRRQDGTAALAVRSLVVALYRSLKHPAEQDRFDALPSTGAPTLGEAIRTARRAKTDTPADRFLRLDEVQAVNLAVAKPAHRLRQLTLAQRHAVARLVDRVPDPLRDEVGRAGLPVLPRVPTGQVVAVWPVGDNEPFGPRLLADGLGQPVLRYLGISDTAPDSVRLHAVLVPTARTAAAALVQADQLGTLPRHATLGAVSATVAEPVELDEPNQVHDVVLRHLERVGAGAEAVLLAPTGRKDVVAGALVACADWSTQVGVPLFLPQTLRPVAGGIVAYHQLAGLLENDAHLLPVAVQAMQRLDLDAASRLLLTGSPRLQRVGHRAQQLANTVRNDLDDPARWVDGIPRSEPNQQLLSARVQLCCYALAEFGSRLRPGDLTRLIHVAWQLVERSDPVLARNAGRLRGFAGRAGSPPRHLPPQSERRRVVAAFRAVRNRLPTTHGTGEEADLRQLIADVVAYHGIPTPTRTRPSPGWLLRRLVEAVSHDTLPGWPDRGGQPDERLADAHRALHAELTQSLPAPR